MQPRTLVFALFPYATLFRSPGGGLRLGLAPHRRPAAGHTFGQRRRGARRDLDGGAGGDAGGGGGRGARSEEHTSELQSRENLVCRLLLEKKSLCCVQRTIRW